MFSHSSGVRKSKIKVEQGLVSGAGSAWLVDGSLLAVSSHGRERERERREKLSGISSYKGTDPIVSGLCLHDPKASISKYQLLVVRTSTCEF